MQLNKFLAVLAAVSSSALADVKPLPGPPTQCPTQPSQPQPPAKRVPYFKISMMINKLDSVSSEYFDQYWNDCDIPLALDCPAFTENVVKFSAIHNTPELRKELGSLGYPMLEYDGIIEFWVKDLNHWNAVTSSECWQTVRKDAQTFTKWPYQFMYGYEMLALDQTSMKPISRRF